MKQKIIIVVFPRNGPILEMKITLYSSFAKVYGREKLYLANLRKFMIAKWKKFENIFASRKFLFAKVCDPEVYILNQP